MRERNYNGLTIGTVVERVEAAKATMETIGTTNQKDYQRFMDGYMVFQNHLAPIKRRETGDVNSIKVNEYSDLLVDLQAMESLADAIAPASTFALPSWAHLSKTDARNIFLYAAWGAVLDIAAMEAVAAITHGQMTGKILAISSPVTAMSYAMVALFAIMFSRWSNSRPQKQASDAGEGIKLTGEESDTDTPQHSG